MPLITESVYSLIHKGITEIQHINQVYVKHIIIFNMQIYLAYRNIGDISLTCLGLPKQVALMEKKKTQYQRSLFISLKQDISISTILIFGLYNSLLLLSCVLWDDQQHLWPLSTLLYCDKQKCFQTLLNIPGDINPQTLGHENHPKCLQKHRLLGPIFRSPDSQIWGGAPIFAFETTSHLMLVMELLNKAVN